MPRKAKKNPLRLIEIKDNHTAIVINYCDSPKVLTRADIIRLIDLENQLYLGTLKNTQFKPQIEPTIDSNPKVEHKSWSALSRKINLMESLGMKVATKETLDELLDYLNSFDWILHKRMDTKALVNLKTIITWNIPETYKQHYSSFIERFKVEDSRLYKGRKRRKIPDYQL